MNKEEKKILVAVARRLKANAGFFRINSNIVRVDWSLSQQGIETYNESIGKYVHRRWTGDKFMIVLENYRQVLAFVKNTPVGVYEVRYIKKIPGLLRQAAFHEQRAIAIRKDKDVQEGGLMEIAIFSRKVV